jgi:hypothetical protein
VTTTISPRAMASTASVMEWDKRDSGTRRRGADPAYLAAAARRFKSGFAALPVNRD